MTQSNCVNPHGLPADQQITSARDMAMLARAVLREFPEYNYYWSLPGIRLGKRVYRNHNNLMGRYDGTDGMKTGFICASGFNVVATATRDGKRLIAVVLGSPSPAVRAVKAAQLFERGFQVRPLSWLTPGLGQVDALQPINVDPPNLRDNMCGKDRRRPPSEEAENDPLADVAADSPYAVFLSTLRGTGNATAGPLLQRRARSASRCASITGPPSAPVDAGAGRGQDQGQGQDQDRQGQEVRRGKADRQAGSGRGERAGAGAQSDRDAGDDRRRRARRKPRRRRPRKPPPKDAKKDGAEATPRQTPTAQGRRQGQGRRRRPRSPNRAKQ